MGVIDIKNFWSVLKVSWFKRALDTEDVWVDYLKLLLSEQGINDQIHSLNCKINRLNYTQ